MILEEDVKSIFNKQGWKLDYLGSAKVCGVLKDKKGNVSMHYQTFKVIPTKDGEILIGILGSIEYIIGPDLSKPIGSKFQNITYTEDDGLIGELGCERTELNLDNYKSMIH